MISVGMDIHVRNSYVHATAADGQLLCRGRCGNTMPELGGFLAPVERAGVAGGEAVRVALEATTNSRGIRQMLLRYGKEAGIDLTVDVLNARKVRIIAESVCKTDGNDAAVLNELMRSNLKLPVCYMPDDEEFALREHLRARSDLVAMRTMLKNRVHALLHRRALWTPTGDLFTRTGRAFLKDLKLDADGREILDRYLAALDDLTAKIEASTGALRGVAKRPRWMKPAALLQSMPGIGLITALTILAELGDMKRFPSRAAVANYAGLVPIIRDSNDKHYSGGITHRGSGHLRAMLIEAALVAVRHVQAYSDLYGRISAKKNKPTGLVAVARRMLEDAFTMIRKEEAFRFVAVSQPRAAAGESRSDHPVASSVAG